MGIAGVGNALTVRSTMRYESTEDRPGISAGFLEVVLIDLTLEEEVGVIGKEVEKRSAQWGSSRGRSTERWVCRVFRGL